MTPHERAKASEQAPVLAPLAVRQLCLARTGSALLGNHGRTSHRRGAWRRWAGGGSRSGHHVRAGLWPGISDLRTAVRSLWPQTGPGGRDGQQSLLQAWRWRPRCQWSRSCEPSRALSRPASPPWPWRTCEPFRQDGGRPESALCRPPSCRPASSAGLCAGDCAGDRLALVFGLAAPAFVIAAIAMAVILLEPPRSGEPASLGQKYRQLARLACSASSCCRTWLPYR